MNSGIYCILNLENGKHYIGSSKDLKRRTSRHFAMLRKGTHHSRILQNAWNKYGEESFRVDILEYSNEGDLEEREQFWIANTIPFYNVLRNAYSPRGHKHSDESRAKFRAAQARRGSEVNEKIAASNKGKIRSKESIENYRAIYNRKNEEERSQQVAAMIAARIGIPVSEEGRLRIADSNKREFIVVSPTGERLVIQNLTSFCKEHGLDRTCMTRVSVGQIKTHKGWLCINPRIEKEGSDE